MRVSKHEVTLRFLINDPDGLSREDHERLLSSMDMIELSMPQAARLFLYEFDELNDLDHKRCLIDIHPEAQVLLVPFGADGQMPMTVVTRHDNWPMGVINIVSYLIDELKRVLPNATYIRSTDYKEFVNTQRTDLDF